MAIGASVSRKRFEEVVITASDFPELVHSLLALGEYGKSHLSLSLDEIFTGLEVVYESMGMLRRKQAQIFQYSRVID